MKYNIILFTLLFPCALFTQEITAENVATYSIVGWDSITGDLGVAVQSKFLGVGAVVPYAKAGVGAIATQAFANTTFGPRGLDLLEKGMSAQEVVKSLIGSDSIANRRQLGIVDAGGNAFAYTGSSCQAYANHLIGKGYAAQGNILAGEAVVRAMAVTFEFALGDLADRLLSALEAAEKAGGDKRGKQSAALLVVRENGGYGGFNDRFIDIRVDDDSLPLVELRRIYNIWQSTFLLNSRVRSIDEFNRKKQFYAAEEEKRRLTNSLNETLRSKPDDPEVLNNIAWILAANEIDLRQALELSKRAIMLAPDKLYILNTIAECHYRMGNFDEAIAIGSELVGKEPTNDNYWKQLQKFKEGKQRGFR